MSTQRREAGRALIVGAGIAGLSTALRLHRGGWEVLVVDKAPSNRSGGTWINGASLAVGGADLLGDVLERRPGDLTAALRAWEAESRPIALKIQAQARRGRESFFLPPSEFAITLRTISLRIAGNAVTTRLLRLFMGVRSRK